MKKKKSRRFFTLIEIMIVIVLIGLIGGVLAYNLTGSLDEGKIFKTKQGGAQVYNILMLEVAKGNPIETVQSDWQGFVERSPLTHKADDLIKDGWGETYHVDLEGKDLIVWSQKYRDYCGQKESDEWQLS